MFELDRAASDWHLIVRAIGQVDDFRRHLRGQAEEICRPCPLRHDLPFLPSCYRARNLIDVRAQLPTERRVHLWNVIEPTPDAPDCSLASQARQRHVDCAPTGDVEKILR